VDDNFLAAYQASYGLPSSESSPETPNDGGSSITGTNSLERDPGGFLIPPMPQSKVKTLFRFKV